MTQRKPRSTWDRGPESASGLFLAAHGLGGPPVYVYRHNPASFLVDPCGTLTGFFSAGASEMDQPINQDAMADVNPSAYSADVGDLGGVPGGIGNGSAYDSGYVSPRTATTSPLVIGQVGQQGIGAPLGVVGTKIVPLWGSRKSTGG